MFGYVRGGYARVLEHFAEVLAKKRVRVCLNSPVERVERVENDIVIEFRDKKEAFQDVILTCSPRVSAKILPQLSSHERSMLDSVRYQGIVCASVLMKEPISEFYVTNITDASPFTGIIEMSAMVDNKEFGGKSLLYLPKYAERDDPLFGKSDEVIEELFLSSLEKMYEHFSRESVEAFRISRVKEVFPVPVLNYSEKVPDMKTSVKGVFVVNSSHITNGTLNVNETIQLAERFLEQGFLKEEHRKGQE